MKIQTLIPVLLPSISASMLIPKDQYPLSPPPPYPGSDAPASRRIVIDETSQSISGSYPLYDLLSISTKSGSVSVSVSLHSASDEEPAPAVLNIRSQSGSINSQLEHLFAGHATRDYVTSIATQSGSMSGTFPLGLQTSLDSRSGSINGVNLVVMPVNSTGPRHLQTTARGGSTSLHVKESFWTGRETANWWQGMTSRHESNSGSMYVDYPESWEGTIEARSTSGSVSVTGRGVQIIRREHGRVYAQKGGDGGKIVIDVRSGSVDLRFV
ncbi:hypothetical protein GGR57DRAFT_54357 [Xylariaceae sp. FL1272]|nr:hypothetical protein GGR57DRAFT_54357 [Xylariaceae sp. FL1272]